MIETRNDNFPSKVYFWNTDIRYFFMKREYFFSLKEKILIETYLEDWSCPPYCMNSACWPQFLLNSTALIATNDVTSSSFTGNENIMPHDASSHYARVVNGASWAAFAFAVPPLLFLDTNASRYSHFSGLCRLLFKCSSFGVDCKVRKSAVLFLCSLTFTSFPWSMLLLKLALSQYARK